ncbi:apelin-like [Polyodon spathula]|uniref:apelin-like n=1 Tax=Polyodon spathula TaxID=7913 RepID=UPI001B7EA9DA|nr:apelin-like [Polyodon spathula]
MNVKIFTLVILIFVSMLYPVSGGPVAAPEESKDLEEGGSIRKQQNAVRSASGHRQASWRRGRRPRPRLSHKGPMPF